MKRKTKDEKYCIDCGKKGITERKRCKECARLYNNARAKERNIRLGRHNYGKTICPICNKEMILWRKEQGSHSTCKPKTIEDYNKIKRSPTGRTISRQLFFDYGINLSNDFIVHHLDENPNNNVPSNLIAMSRSSHNSLHRYLQYNRSLFLKENSSNFENCWNILRDHLTKAWLETSSAKVLKISDIGQSAAEPLSSIEYEEGSEAMYEESKSL